MKTRHTQSDKKQFYGLALRQTSQKQWQNLAKNSQKTPTKHTQKLVKGWGEYVICMRYMCGGVFVCRFVLCVCVSCVVVLREKQKISRFQQG